MTNEHEKDMELNLEDLNKIVGGYTDCLNDICSYCGNNEYILEDGTGVAKCKLCGNPWNFIGIETVQTPW